MMTFAQAAGVYAAAAEGDAKKEAAFWLFEAAQEEKRSKVDWDILKAALQDACEFDVVGLAGRGTPEEVRELIFRIRRTAFFLSDCARAWSTGEILEEQLDGWIDSMLDEVNDAEIEIDLAFQA